MTSSLDDLLGRGPSYPLRLGPSGRVVESAGQDRIAESIRIILGTQHGERVMRPDFGANLRSLAFAGPGPATVHLARHLVVDALARWEPRVTVDAVEVSPDPERGELVVAVTYSTVGTDGSRVVTVGIPSGGGA